MISFDVQLTIPKVTLKKEKTWEPEAAIVNNAALLSLHRRQLVFWIVILLQEAPWMQQVGFVAGLWSRKRLCEQKSCRQSEAPPVAFPPKKSIHHLQPWKTQNFLVKRCNLRRTLRFKKRSDSFGFHSGTVWVFRSNLLASWPRSLRLPGLSGEYATSFSFGDQQELDDHLDPSASSFHLLSIIFLDGQIRFICWI